MLVESDFPPETLAVLRRDMRKPAKKPVSKKNRQNLTGGEIAVPE